MGKATTRYEVLHEIKGSIEATLSEMLTLKRNKQRGRELRELITEASVKFLDLRQVNRSILQDEDRVKAETDSLKAPLDHITLQLHNLLYEKTYYMKAINTCKDFKSKYPDIHLVSEEEFFRDAPDELKSDEKLREDAHKLSLQRLHFELHQRKGLCEQREVLEAKKKKLQESLAGRKKFLSSLPSHLKTVKKASLQVQQQLGMLHMNRMKQHQLAELLAPPLYILYTQLVTEREASGENIDVEITGSAKEAQAVARQMMSRMAGSAKDELRGDEDVEEEDDSQRRRKRAKRAHEKGNADGEGVYNSHPLAVLLHIGQDQKLWTEKQSKTSTLRFEFLPKVNVVCAGLDLSQGGDQSNWLVNLFPDDQGLDLPNQSGATQFGGNHLLDKRRSLRPYKWAQLVAGMDFFAEASLQTLRSPDLRCAAVSEGLAVYREQHRIQTFLQAVLQRRKALLALKEQLDCLFKLKLPPVKAGEAPWAQHKSKCGLRSWSEVQPVDLRGDGGDVEGGREDGELPSSAQGVNGSSEVYSSKEAHALKASPTKDRAQPKQMDVEMSESARNSSRRSGASKQVSTTGDPLDGGNQEASLGRQESVKDGKMPSALRKEAPKSKEPAKNKGSWDKNGERDFRAVLRREGQSGGRHLQIELQVKVSVQYPSQIPVFHLDWVSTESTTNPHPVDELLDMEAKVNSPGVECGNNVLAVQLALVCKLLDEYNEKKLART